MCASREKRENSLVGTPGHLAQPPQGQARSPSFHSDKLTISRRHPRPSLGQPVHSCSADLNHRPAFPQGQVAPWRSKLLSWALEEWLEPSSAHQGGGALCRRKPNAVSHVCLRRFANDCLELSPSEEGIPVFFS